MVLLNDVVHVLAGPALAFAWQEFVSLQVTDSTDVSGILINVDYSWGSNVRPTQNFSEETLGCSSATGLIQEEIKRLTGGIDGSVQIHPLAPDFDIGLIHPPVDLIQFRPDYLDVLLSGEHHACLKRSMRFVYLPSFAM